MHDINEFLILFPFYEKPSTTMFKQRYNKTIRSTASNKDSLSKYTEADLNYTVAYPGYYKCSNFFITLKRP